MNEARKYVSDADLAGELARFNGQEGQHYKQHMLFNDAVKAFGIPFPRLAAFEAELEADYRRFSVTRSLRWNLAYAEGFEALTTAMARASFERGPDPAMHEAAAKLFSWHLIEELEHRTVAFDVYDHLCGSYPYRLAVGTWAQWHMGRWIARVARSMYEADPRVPAEYGGQEGRKARLREEAADARKRVLPKVLRTYLPGYTPHDIDFTPEMLEASRAFSEMAVKLG